MCAMPAPIGRGCYNHYLQAQLSKIEVGLKTLSCDLKGAADRAIVLKLQADLKNTVNKACLGDVEEGVEALIQDIESLKDCNIGKSSLQKGVNVHACRNLRKRVLALSNQVLYSVTSSDLVARSILGSSLEAEEQVFGDFVILKDDIRDERDSLVLRINLGKEDAIDELKAFAKVGHRWASKELMKFASEGKEWAKNAIKEFVRDGGNWLAQVYSKANIHEAWATTLLYEVVSEGLDAGSNDMGAFSLLFKADGRGDRFKDFVREKGVLPLLGKLEEYSQLNDDSRVRAAPLVKFLAENFPEIVYPSDARLAPTRLLLLFSVDRESARFKNFCRGQGVLDLMQILCDYNLSLDSGSPKIIAIVNYLAKDFARELVEDSVTLGRMSTMALQYAKGEEENYMNYTVLVMLVREFDRADGNQRECLIDCITTNPRLLEDPKIFCLDKGNLRGTAMIPAIYNRLLSEGGEGGIGELGKVALLRDRRERGCVEATKILIARAKEGITDCVEILGETGGWGCSDEDRVFFAMRHEPWALKRLKPAWRDEYAHPVGIAQRFAGFSDSKREVVLGYLQDVMDQCSAPESDFAAFLQLYIGSSEVKDAVFKEANLGDINARRLIVVMRQEKHLEGIPKAAWESDFDRFQSGFTTVDAGEGAKVEKFRQKMRLLKG